MDINSITILNFKNNNPLKCTESYIISLRTVVMQAHANFDPKVACDKGADKNESVASIDQPHTHMQQRYFIYREAFGGSIEYEIDPTQR